MEQKRAVDCLPYLPEDVCRRFADWCIFEEAKPAIVALLQRDELYDLAQYIESSLDYETLGESTEYVFNFMCEMIHDALNDMEDEDPQVIEEQERRFQVCWAAATAHEAIRTILEDTYASVDIPMAAVQAVTVTQESHEAAEQRQDAKLIELCNWLGVDGAALCP